MVPFEQIWSVLYNHGASQKQQEGTQRFWCTLTPEQQQRAFTTITTKLREGKFVWYDPIRALKEALRQGRTEKQQILSYAEYYAKYGTTEEKDGWKMANPTGEKVVYVRN